MASRDWTIGSRIKNRWQIHDIKRGGMGVVYIVYDHEWKEAFAAKTFQDEVFDRNPAAANRFIKEAHAWVNLDIHENITQARFVEDVDGKPYLFLEYVSGGDLGQWIGPRLTANQSEVVRLSIQFCDGMTHALSKGVKAHRDIKPGNCLVTEGGTMKITDFGLAKVLDDVEPNPHNGNHGADHLSIMLSQTGTAAGTPPFMAPEQFVDSKHVDVRADVYSFGIMLFLMVAGDLPFKAKNASEYAKLHRREPLPRIGPIDTQLRTIIEKCAAKDANKRYEDFVVVRQALADVFERLTGRKTSKPKLGRELDAFSLVNKGVSLKRLGRLNEAAACYEKALSLNPQMPEAWLNKGSVLDAMGQHREAISCYNRCLRFDPSVQQAWYNKGIALSALGESLQSIACFEKARTLNPYDDNAWYCESIALSRIGRSQEAIAISERCVRVNPGNVSAWYNMGALWGALKDFAKAVGCYERATRLNPSHAQAWFNMGHALLTLGKPGAAIEALNRAVALTPTDQDAWFMKGAALETLRRYDEAIEAFRQAGQLGHANASQAIRDCQSRLRSR